MNNPPTVCKLDQEQKLVTAEFRTGGNRVKSLVLNAGGYVASQVPIGRRLVTASNDFAYFGVVTVFMASQPHVIIRTGRHMIKVGPLRTP